MIRDFDIETLSLACSPEINLAAFWVTVHQYLSNDLLGVDDTTLVLIGRLMQAYDVNPGEERQPTIPRSELTGKLRVTLYELVNHKASNLVNDASLQKYVVNLAAYYGPQCVYEYAMAFAHLATLVPEGALTAEVCENLPNMLATMQEILHADDRVI